MELALAVKWGAYPVYAQQVDYKDYYNLIFTCPECHEVVFLKKGTVYHNQQGTKIEKSPHFSHHRIKDNVPQDDVCNLRVKQYNQEKVTQLVTQSKQQWLKSLEQYLFDIYWENHLNTIQNGKYAVWENIINNERRYLPKIFRKFPDRFASHLRRISLIVCLQDQTWVEEIIREAREEIEEFELNEEAKFPEYELYDSFTDLRNKIEVQLHYKICQEIYSLLISKTGEKLLEKILLFQWNIFCDDNFIEPDDSSNPDYPYDFFVSELKDNEYQEFADFLAELCEDVIKQIVKINWFEHLQTKLNYSHKLFKKNFFSQHFLDIYFHNRGIDLLLNNFRLEVEDRDKINHSMSLCCQRINSDDELFLRLLKDFDLARNLEKKLSSSLECIADLANDFPQHFIDSRPDSYHELLVANLRLEASKYLESLLHTTKLENLVKDLIQKNIPWLEQLNPHLKKQLKSEIEELRQGFNFSLHLSICQQIIYFLLSPKGEEILNTLIILEVSKTCFCLDICKHRGKTWENKILKLLDPQEIEDRKFSLAAFKILIQIITIDWIQKTHDYRLKKTNKIPDKRSLNLRKNIKPTNRQKSKGFG